MRTILLIICILSVTLTGKAQTGNEWDTGSYYDQKGYKFTGFVYWSPPFKHTLSDKDDYIFFKTTTDGQKVKVWTKEIKCFTMGKDSFVVTHQKDLKQRAFLAVVLNSPTKLYLSTTTQSGAPATRSMMPVGSFGPSAIVATVGLGWWWWKGNNNVYYYGADPDNITQITRKNYLEIFSQLMADKPEVVACIRDKKFKFGRIDDLIEYYKTGIIPKTEIKFLPKTKDGKADDMY